MPDAPADALAKRFGLAGRTAAVTGASRGIGAVIAAGLATAGARVYGLSRSGTGSEGVQAFSCDVSNPAAVEAAFSTIGADAGQLNVLINAAGISLGPSNGSPSEEIERFRTTLEADLVSVYATVLAARRLLKASGRGSIVNVTSINSSRGFPGNPGYVAAKAGLTGLTRALAVDLAADGIRVNALAPGYVHTAMTDASYRDPALNAQRRRQTILDRWGEPDDLVGAALFLASDASAYMTGQEIIIDGGWTAKGLVT
ncbi:MAG: SDR family oxidoreductase [Hyphomicrobiaceae bacterium]